jgi:hypothetical protein
MRLSRERCADGKAFASTNKKLGQRRESEEDMHFRNGHPDKNTLIIMLGMYLSRSRFSSLLTGAMAQSMSTSAKEVSFCFVTTPNQETADKLSALLVTEKLAACVNVIPGRSFPYRMMGFGLETQNIL